MLLVSIKPSRQQFSFTEVSIDCHFSLSRVCVELLLRRPVANWLVAATVRLLLSLACALDARSYWHVRMPLTHYSHCITAQPTIRIWLEDNHVRLLAYLLNTSVVFISC